MGGHLLDTSFCSAATHLLSKEINPMVVHMSSCSLAGLDCRDGNGKAQEQCIKEGQARMRTLNPSYVSSTDPEICPVTRTVDNIGLGYSFSVNQVTRAACQTADRKDPKSITM